MLGSVPELCKRNLIIFVTEINVIIWWYQVTWAIFLFFVLLYSSNFEVFKQELEVKVIPDSACSLFLLQKDVLCASKLHNLKILNKVPYPYEFLFRYL